MNIEDINTKESHKENHQKGPPPRSRQSCLPLPHPRIFHTCRNLRLGLDHTSCHLPPLPPLIVPGEPARHSLDHLSEPVIVEQVQDAVAAEVDTCQPQWHALPCKRVWNRITLRVHVPGSHTQNSGGVAVEVEYIRHNQVAAPGAVDDAAAEERTQKEEPVDELRAGAGQADLVAKPVDIEEWRGELKKDKYGGVEIDKRAL